MSKIVYSKQDNWKTFNYKNVRILDALSSMFHVISPCASSIIYNNVLYISFNSHIRSTTDFVTVFKKNIIFNLMKQAVKMSADDLLKFYLILNVDFVRFIKTLCKYETDVERKELLQIFILSHGEVKTFFLNSIPEKLENESSDSFNQRKTDHELNFEILKEKGLIDVYYHILKHFGDTKHSEMAQLLRPLQDCMKIKQSIENKDLSIKDVLIVDNKETIHAEVNISLHFPLKYILKKVTGSTYIGTSKLCCAYCHKYLVDNNYDHRGSHGIADQEWKMNISGFQKEDFRDDIFKNSNDLRDLNSKPEVMQYRSLSNDKVFESKIIDRLGQTLHAFKKTLRLN